MNTRTQTDIYIYIYIAVLHGYMGAYHTGPLLRMPPNEKQHGSNWSNGRGWGRKGTCVEM